MSRNRNRKSEPYSKETYSPERDITQREELPGVDHKNKLGPRKLKNQRLDLTNDQGQLRFLGSVTKELSKKSNIQQLQTSFQKQSLAEGGVGTDALCKTVRCTNQQISIELSNPLDNITVPHYINNNKNSELVKDIPHKNLSGEEDEAEDCDDEDAAAKLRTRPSVIAVNLKWKQGITLRKAHKYSTKVHQLEPLMKKTEFNYETKTKFANQVESACDEILPDWRRKLMILDGNDCSYGTMAGMISTTSSASSSGKSDNSPGGSKMAKSESLQKEESVNAPIQPDPFCRQWSEYTDLEEHKILVIPQHSKHGFDTDLSTRYQFPYQAKFVIGRRAYHHKFMLQLPLTKTPQHYGLIFTFSEDPKGHAKFRIKSLLSVYCIYPVSPKLATLETYEMNPDSDEYSDEGGSSSQKKTSLGRKTAGSGATGRAAKNAVKLLSDNLKEDKLVAASNGQLGLERQLAQPGEDSRQYRTHYINYFSPEKLKAQKKKQIMKNIRMEQARC